MAKNKGIIDAASIEAARDIAGDDFDELLQEIEAAGGEPVREIRARVYRVTVNDRGKDFQEYCGAFNNIIDEETIGKKYGSGKYRIYYDWKNETGRKQTTRAVNIGREFAGAFKDDPKPTQVETPAPAFSLNSIISGLTVEKVSAIVAAVEGIKKILTPPPPPPPQQIDVVKLLEVMQAIQPKGQTVSDAIVLKAMDMQKPAEKTRTLSEQLRELQEAKETINALTDGATENGGDNMNVWLKTGLELLPMLLKANGGNYQAAGAAAREIPKVNELIANDPEIAQEFIGAVAAKYGDAAAQELARGFNYEMTREAIAQETPQETPAAPEAAPAEGSAQA